MRTFLTYVLAIALLTFMAVAPIIVIGAVVYSEGMGHGGEWPSLSAWWLSISNMALLAALVAASLILVAVPAWIIWQRRFAGLHARFGHRSSLLGGPLVALAIGLAALTVRAAIWFEDFRQNVFGEAAFYILLAAIAGAAWGTVFWIRAPKPTTAGIAA